MTNLRSIAFYPVVLSAVLALAGCSSTTAEPELSSTAPATPSPESKTELTPGPAPSTSSLEAFQRGESTATPASSPLKEVYFDFDRYDHVFHRSNPFVLAVRIIAGTRTLYDAKIPRDQFI